MTGESCSWYHGIWQILRLMGLGGSPAIHAEFYRHALGIVARQDDVPRVLISGAADYAMLAHVLAAFAAANRRPAVTVVDICETPLWLNRWYAERRGAEIETQQCDAAAFASPRPFDAICTHSFFGQIPVARRPALMAAWQKLLRPGGILITADRVRPASGEDPVRFTPDQARTFVAKVMQGAKAMGNALPAGLAELSARAESYASRQALFPVRSRSELHEALARAGFDIAESSGGPNELEAQTSDSGPAIPASAEYALVIARRK